MMTSSQDPALPLVRHDAEKALMCSPAQVTVVRDITGIYKATGCGRTARYRSACVGIQCEVRPIDAPPIPDRGRPTPEGT